MEKEEIKKEKKGKGKKIALIIASVVVGISTIGFAGYLTGNKETRTKALGKLKNITKGAKGLLKKEEITEEVPEKPAVHQLNSQYPKRERYYNNNYRKYNN